MCQKIAILDLRKALIASFMESSIEIPTLIRAEGILLYNFDVALSTVPSDDGS